MEVSASLIASWTSLHQVSIWNAKNVSLRASANTAMTLMKLSTALLVLSLHSRMKNSAVLSATLTARPAEENATSTVFPANLTSKLWKGLVLKYVEMARTMGTSSAMTITRYQGMGNIKPYYPILINCEIFMINFLIKLCSCNSNCMIEDTYYCFGGSNSTKDICG